MFNNVLRCLVSHATISIAASAAADRDNTAGISDNAPGIGDNVEGIGNIAAKVIPC